MRIANPIYDSVFNHLMEDAEVARALIERLLGCELLDLEPQPHEITERRAAGMGDAQALMRVYRIDFAATVRLAGGAAHKVLIELQKTGKSEAVSRFRNYLSRHYAVPATAPAPLPVIAIYLLGFELSPELPVVTQVRRQYLDAVSGGVLSPAARVPFIEQLTHDAVVVQIPRIASSTNTPLERILQVFNQDYLDDLNPHYLRVPANLEDVDDRAVRQALRTLLKAAADDETSQQMNVEDELTHMLDDLDMARLQTEEQRRQKEEERRQKEEERRQKEEERRQKEEERRQKEEALDKVRALEARLAALDAQS